MLRKDLTAKFLDFTLVNHLKSSALKPKIEAPDAGEEGCNFVTHSVPLV